MTWTARSVSGSANNAVTMAVTVGDFIFAGGDGPSVGTITCSDNASGGSNAYTQMAIANGNRPGTMAMFGAIAKATETVTITLAGTASPELIVAGIFYDSGGTASLTADATASHDTNHSVSLTTVADALILAICDSSGANPTEGTGFTLIASTGGSTVRLGGEYDLAATAGANTVAFADVGQTPRGMVAMAVVVPSTGPSIPVVYTRRKFASL